MLANSWASAGGTLTSRRTRSVADPRSAARSCAIVVRRGAALRDAEADRGRGCRGQDQPGLQLSEMLPVLGQQAFQDAHPARRLAVHGRLVQRDHGPFGRDDLLQRDHVR